MRTLMKLTYVTTLLTILILLNGCGPGDWQVLFDGETFDGWEASDNKGSWIIEDGAFVTNGPRSHLFYTGEVLDHEFKNFEFMVDVKTLPGANSGIYIHTEFQDEGWPYKGYECQVINSRPDIQTYINDQLIAEYTEPENPYRPESFSGRLLSSGTFAFQCHDPGSKVYYKNIKVKPLPDDLPTPGKALDDPEFEAKIIDQGAGNFPLIDLHVHLKQGLTLDDALKNARMYGYSYGIAVNCGLKMGFETDEAVLEFLDNYPRPPHAWLAMQAEGREWFDMFSEEVISKFDYVFTDAMTWTNDNGKRMRLWIPEETEVGDPQDFMEQLVDRIEKILTEPVDIYVNPTYLPPEINARYDELWTPERMDRVIKALVDNQVAFEINNRRRIPSPAFIKRAKDAGVKFTFGTNNGGVNDLGRMDYALEMITECGLTTADMWIPES